MRFWKPNTIGLFVACWIGATAATFAGTVSEFGADVFARVRDTSGATQAAELSVAQQGDSTYINSHTKAATGVAATSKYTFIAAANGGSFKADFNHLSTTDGNWQTKSDGTIDFVLSHATSFSIAGLYGSAFTVALSQSVSLQNISDPLSVTEVFYHEQSGDGIGRSLVLGDGGGTMRGEASGILAAGTYRFTYSNAMQSVLAPPSGTTRLAPGDTHPPGPGHHFDEEVYASGNFDLQFGPSAVPLPPAVWAGMSLLGLFGAGNVAKRFRQRNEIV